MIPESGSVSEFKGALANSLCPQQGEVYLRDKKIAYEYWQVLSCSWSNHVVFESYWCLGNDTCIKKNINHNRMTAYEWEELIREGRLSFVGWVIPGKVLSKQETAKLVYTTLFDR